MRPAEEIVLPGEDPRSTHPDDVRHWVAVYEELLRGVLAVCREVGREPDAQLGRTAQRYARRLRYWRSRAADDSSRAPP